MYLYSKLQSLNKDISICFIGCGKFISEESLKSSVFALNVTPKKLINIFFL